MRAWLRERQVGDAVLEDALLTVGEACANAIEHAYFESEPSDVCVEIEEDAESLVVAVRDFGRFRQPCHADDRGRGNEIISRLATDISRNSTCAGTTVRFRLPISRPARGPTVPS